MRSDGPKWNFEPVSPMGGATGAAFVNTLLGAGKSPEEELAREAIQNSCDAAGVGHKVRVVFRILRLHGSDRERFVTALSLREGIGPRRSLLQLPRTNWLAQQDKPLQVTFVEDYGTVGLFGDPHKRHSNFYKLLLSVGDVSKASREATGGSYGYGKSALSMNSRLRTVVAYSAFSRDETGVTARLMGCAYFDPHELNGHDFTGRAWFAVQQRRGNDSVWSPVEDGEAQALAERLGFERRAAGDYGTSLLIVDSHVDHAKLLGGIAESWWPRLVDQDLEVVVRVDGEAYYPRPRQRADLIPFIECYALASGKSEPQGNHQRRGEFNRLRGLGPGCYGFQVLTDERARELQEERLGAVALIRSPRMVVEYAKLGREAPPAVGVFVADREIDEILKLSEPPTHDRWDEDSRRLEQAEPDEDTARHVVRQSRKRLRDQIRKLQAEAEPPRPPEERRLRLLEREFGMLLQPPTRGPVIEPHDAVPVELSFREGPTANPVSSGMLETRSKVALRLRSDAEDDRRHAVLRVRVSVLEDDEGREGDYLPVDVVFESRECVVDELPSEDEERKFSLDLSKDRWVVFSMWSEPYDAGWATKVGVELEPPEAGA